MANYYILTAPVIAILLFCLSGSATARTRLFSVNHQDGKTSLQAKYKAYGDGLCKALVKPQGYVCEEHEVTTEDGYILNIQRMPVARSGKPADKPPVLLQHGVLVGGFVWVMNSPEQSLAFILADQGYDVWIANTRGSTYSQGHTSLNSNDPAYWYWTLDQLASYDLPAIFQYINGQTGQKLHFVGHSLGTTIALAAFSERKMLNMIRSAALLCPIAHLNHITTLPAKAAANLFLGETVYWLGLYKFVPGGKIASKLIQEVCVKTLVDCSNVIDAFTGPSCCVNESRMHIFYENEPQPTSTKNMVHMSQMVRSGKMSMYDYGSDVANMEHYKQSTPPVYNISNIPTDLPLFVAYGGTDMLADLKDVTLLLDDLKGHQADKLMLVFKENYAHADFVYGVNANRDIYVPLLSFFNLN